ncbi:MAG: YigZ family protein, partial [Clostridia bacterium]|nr:YigZ family protein [Clostridia bacterium]
MKYLTIENAAQDEFTEKRSRFIGYAKPVTTEAEATAFIEEIRKKHWDAKHNVYAYVLREGNAQRYSDDGEPQGTAGVPTLDVLKKQGVTDCVVVVTRYFGGILLGGGGLVRAYSHAASIALQAAGIVEMRSFTSCETMLDYNLYGRLPALIAELSGKVTDTDFADAVRVKFLIPEEFLPLFAEKFADLTLGKGTF